MVITVLPPPILGLGTAGGFKAQLEDHSNAGPAKLYDMTQALVAKARQTPSLAGVFSTYDVNAPQLQADVDRVKVKQLGIDLEEVFRTMQVYLGRSEEHTSELQSLMRISYAVFCLKKKKNKTYR